MVDCAKVVSEVIIKEMQAEAFPEVLEYLKTKGHRKRDLPGILTRMNLYIDKRGILRVGSKMLRFQERKEYVPILLPQDHHVTKLIVWKAHRVRCHNGVRAVLSELQPQFWIIKGKATVKKILRQCVHCRM